MYNATQSKGEKRSDVFTPPIIASRIYEVIQESNLQPKTILDPAIGNCNLVDPFLVRGYEIIGIDVIKYFRTELINQFLLADYEKISKTKNAYLYNGKVIRFKKPDLILCNPPFNGEKKRKLYPEIFLRKSFELFGYEQPIVLFTPYGLRLNQKKHSKRIKWMKEENVKITGILSLPVDAFENVKFHSEVLFFNIEGIKPHYWY